jgi:AcrR family transcriptional regulator
MLDHERSRSTHLPRVESRGDIETRARVLNAAARLFADRGVARVTVRDICKKARANVAAVNYHFGGKDGLYQAVMRMTMETMQATTDAARAAGQNLPPEARIRAYIAVFADRLIGAHHETWIHQLMMREMADPTPMLAMVKEQVLKPRMAYLCGTIAELIGCKANDPRVVRCALSITAQFNGMLWKKAVAELMNAPDAVDDAIDDVAEHIARFSLGGITATRRSG